MLRHEREGISYPLLDIYIDVRKKVAHAFLAIAAAAIATTSPPVVAASAVEKAKAMIPGWYRHAPLCDGYPSKLKDDGSACNDGDMNLFSGLLCAAGIDLGCRAVRAALEDSGAEQGRWHRSPRRRLDPSIAEDEAKDGVGSFSPDMALGSQLYLATKMDKSAGRMWLEWLDKRRPCLAGSEPTCDLRLGPVLVRGNVRGWPRFCTNDAPSPGEPGKGCTMRPGDLANLAHTSFVLRLSPATTCNANLDNFGNYLGALVDIEGLINEGLPRLLRLSCGLAAGLNRVSAEFNRAGYSQHLVGVEVLLLQKLGVSDPRLRESARALSAKQPKNPFFQHLAGVSSETVATNVLALCPGSDAQMRASPKTEWAWERADSIEAWKQASLWDCIFMAELLTPQAAKDKAKRQSGK